MNKAELQEEAATATGLTNKDAHKEIRAFARAMQRIVSMQPEHRTDGYLIQVR